MNLVDLGKKLSERDLILTIKSSPRHHRRWTATLQSANDPRATWQARGFTLEAVVSEVLAKEEAETKRWLEHGNEHVKAVSDTSDHDFPMTERGVR